MRRIKHKHTRRAVRFYKVQHGFRTPFKVLLDGNFLHSLLLASQEDISSTLFKLLGAPVKALTTACILHELKLLGRDFTGTLRFARQACAVHACGHDEEPLAASECLQSCIGDTNPEHFFVATQDRSLREAVGKVPGGASLLMSGNGIHLEQPSDFQQSLALQDAEAQNAPSKAELKSSALKDLTVLQRQPKEKSIFRRKGAKAPNPLSVKKKKPKAPQQQQQQKQQSAATADAQGTQPHRKRKRRKGAAERSEAQH